MNNQTPEPWHVRTDEDGHHIESADNVTLAKVYAHPYDDDGQPPYGLVKAPEGHANALAIVRAINTRDQLLRACLAALSQLMPALPPGMQPVRNRADTVDMLVAAIQAATKEEL